MLNDHAHGSGADAVTEAVAWRHHLHRHPELAFCEFATSDFVTERLAEFGIRIHRGLGGTGVVGTLSRGSGNRVIGLRADMDALPILEESGVAHASATPGRMHACGHDGHVATLLAAARQISRMPDIDGTVHFIFQPAEEGEAGAKAMIDQGLFRQFPCDRIYALHNWPSLPVGNFVARDDAMMAATATFEIIVAGRGCHGAIPDEGRDPLLAAAQITNALQSVVSRNIPPLDPAVLSVTQIHGGSAWNAIPDRCVISGTTRWFSDRNGALLRDRIVEIAELGARAMGCEASTDYKVLFPATINDALVACTAREVAADPALALKVIDSAPSMASEDFAFMLGEVPGCYAWIGGGDASHAEGLHSPRFDFNDAILPLGADYFTAVVRRELQAA